MKKIIAIGDIHGLNIWKDIVNKEQDGDLFIFIGDYFDNKYGISSEDELNNFKEIIEFKKNNLNKVILLLGNHDFHYLSDVNENYSGYNFGMSKTFNFELENCLKDKLLQMSYYENKMLFSHAGVTNTWLKPSIEKEYITLDYNNLNLLSEGINDLLFYKRNFFKFTMGRNFSVTGDDVTQSPIWVRPKSLRKDSILNVTQIVGHTYQDCIDINGNDDNIILIDTLGTSKEYLIIQIDDNKNNIFSVGKISNYVR